MKNYTLYFIIILAVAVMGSPVSQAQQPLQLSLDSCESLALKNNLTLRNAALQVDMAKDLKKAALMEYFPTLKLTGGSFVSSEPLFEVGLQDIDNVALRELLQNYVNEYGAYYGLDDKVSLFDDGILVGVNATQVIYAGGRIRTGNHLARIGIEAAELQKNVSSREVINQTENYYWQIISLQEKLKTLDELNVLLDTLFRDVNAATQAGLMTKNEVYKVTLKRNEAALNTKKVTDGLTLLKMLLCCHIGIANQDIALVENLEDMSAPDSYFVSSDQAVGQRDESRLLELNVEAEALKKKMQLGETLPSLALGAAYSYNNLYDDSRYNGMLFATLQVPISDWGKNTYNLRRQNSKQQIAINQRNDLVDKMKLQIDQAWYVLQQNWLQIEMAQVSVADAEANLKLTQDYYHSGMVALSELLEAQTLFRQSRDQYIDACIAYKISLLNYKQLSGQESCL